MSTIITLAICAILVMAITWALIKGVWAASKKITLPIQVVLFVVILFCIGRMLFTKENAKKLYDGIEQSGVSQNMENTVRTALKMKSEAVSASVAPSASAATPTSAAATEPTVPSEKTPATQAPSAETTLPVPILPTAAPATVPEPAPKAKPDYGRLDKGKKSFSYALPFGAQVKVGFRDGTYRLIAESMGTLSGSEKKEIGKMVMNALSEYSGEKISGLDKSQVKIDAQYDDAANRTRVFVTVPPSAIE